MRLLAPVAGRRSLPRWLAGGFTERVRCDLGSRRPVCTVAWQANTAVFTERMEVRLRTDQKERLAVTADALGSDVAALVRLAIDNMFYDMDEIRRRDASWRRAVEHCAATTRS